LLVDVDKIAFILMTTPKTLRGAHSSPATAVIPILLCLLLHLIIPKFTPTITPAPCGKPLCYKVVHFCESLSYQYTPTQSVIPLQLVRSNATRKASTRKTSRGFNHSLSKAVKTIRTVITKSRQNNYNKK